MRSAQALSRLRRQLLRISDKHSTALQTVLDLPACLGFRLFDALLWALVLPVIQHAMTKQWGGSFALLHCECMLCEVYCVGVLQMCSMHKCDQCASGAGVVTGSGLRVWCMCTLCCVHHRQCLLGNRWCA